MCQKFTEEELNTMNHDAKNAVIYVIKVYVGTDGIHQDEFLRGDHPRMLFRGSIATASLEAAIINAKYVNSNPLDRLSRDFKANGLNLSKQTMPYFPQRLCRWAFFVFCRLWWHKPFNLHYFRP